MKTIIKNIMLSGCCMLTLVMSTGCDNFLDVRPKAEKLERDLFSTPQGFEDAIYGVYGEMQSDALYGMNLTWGINELLAQQLYCGSTAGEALCKYNYTENSDVRKMFSNTWIKAYETIGYANNILDQLKKYNEKSLPLYNYYKAEMLGVRALIHFDLLRLFCSVDMAATGIPYVRDYSPTVKPFESVEANYKNIIADLTEAITLLDSERAAITYPRNNSNYNKFLNHQETHLNLYALEAILARVYWMKGDNANAAKYAVDVINSKAFPLVTENEVKDYVAGVLSPKETIFGLYSTSYAATSKSYLYEFRSFFSYTPYYNGTATGTNYQEPYTALYAKNITGTEQDRRLDHFKQHAGYALWLKMVDYYTIEGSKRGDSQELIKGISVLHSAELYLIAASALLDTDYNQAVALFDAEIQSRGLTSYKRQDKKLTHEILFDEYRKEMFGEGQTWYNMKRLNRDIVSNLESRTIPASQNIYNIPIPQEEYEYRNLK